ncbi:uncharacterized protein LOC134275952 [Saccostrea cucullata]|uniref:uncharacterized protein LOC134275952 n=1 Tax=Saccostrea cuccullata TaxID=36930 RepID=UPI002ED5EDF3
MAFFPPIQKSDLCTRYTKIFSKARRTHFELFPHEACKLMNFNPSSDLFSDSDNSSSSTQPPSPFRFSNSDNSSSSTQPPSPFNFEDQPASPVFSCFRKRKLVDSDEDSLEVYHLIKFSPLLRYM